MAVKSKAFMARCLEFFGKKPEQTLKDFAAELRELTMEDKLEFHEAFNDMGLPTEPPIER